MSFNPLNAAQTGDGYLAFYTDAYGIGLAGDNDLFWDRANNQLQLSGGGLNSSANFTIDNGTTTTPEISWGNGSSNYLRIGAAGAFPVIGGDSSTLTFQVDINGTGGAKTYVFKHGSFTAGGGTEISRITSDGSATSPYISVGGDTDTGIGAAALDQLSVIAGGSEAMRLTTTTINANELLNVTADMSISTQGSIGLGGTSANIPQIFVDGINAEINWGVGSVYERSLIFTDVNNNSSDHGHSTQTNPTVFIHSVTDPASDDTQWMSFTHDQTDGYIQTGTGDIVLAPNSSIVTNEGALSLREMSAPTNLSGFGRLYVSSSDNNIHFIDSAGSDTDLTAGGGGGGGDVSKTSGFTGADGYIAFWTGTSEIAGDNDLFWDRANNSLGIGNSAPDNRFHVKDGSSGGSSDSASVATFESDSNFALQFLSPSTSVQYLFFGDDNATSIGRIAYDHNAGTMFFTVENQTGAIFSLDGSDVDLRLVGQNNDANTPTLGFGDGDSGFYETSDDTIAVSTGGFGRFTWSGLNYSSTASGGPSMRGFTASDTVPTFNPNKDDSNTGIGAAALDQLSLIAGGVEGLRITGDGPGQPTIDAYGDLQVQGNSRLILPQVNDETNPTLAFGDGNTGLFEGGDNALRIATDGTSRWQITGDDIQSIANPGPTIRNVNTSSTVPAYVFRFDYDTGIGSAGSDELSLIAAGSEIMRLSTTEIKVNQDINIAGGNNISTDEVEGTGGSLTLNAFVLNLQSSGTGGSKFHFDNISNEQMLWEISNDLGRQLVITDRDNSDQDDHGHPVQDNPTIFIHSSTAVDTDDTQWISFTHNQTDGYIQTGSGDIVLAADGYVRIEDNLKVSGQLLSTYSTNTSPAGTVATINWNNGNVQTLDLENATGDVTVTLSDGQSGGSYVLSPRKAIESAALMPPNESPVNELRTSILPP